MAFLGIRAPHEAARLIHEIDVPGEKEDSAHLHITLLYLGKDVSVEELARAMVATYSVTKDTSPFWVSLNCVNYFPVPDGMPFPIVAPVISPKLHELRKNLAKTFGRAKIDYDKRFKVYHPHVTLSFNDTNIKKTKIEPIEWAVQMETAEFLLHSLLMGYIMVMGIKNVIHHQRKTTRIQKKIH